MKKPLRREEWLLFLAPLLTLALAYVAGPIRRFYFPAQIPKALPKPKPVIPNLWSEYNDFFTLLPTRDGKIIYTLGRRNRSNFLVNAWDAKTGVLRRAFCVSNYGDRDGLALSDDGRKLAYTGDNYFGESRLREMRIGIYDAERGVRLRTLGDKPNSGAALFLPNLHTLFVGLDGKFQVWNADNGKLLKQVSWLESDAIASSLRFPVVSRDGKTLAVLRDETQSGDAYANGRRDEIGLFSTRNWKCRDLISWPQTSINALAFVGDGQTLLVRTSTFHWAKKKSGANDVYPITKLRWIDLKTRRERIMATSPRWSSEGFRVSPDRRYFALTHSFSATTPPVNQTVELIWEKAFIEIRDSFSGRKIASLSTNKDSFCGPMSFASDNSVLYFSRVLGS